MAETKKDCRKKEGKTAPVIYWLKSWTNEMIKNNDYSVETFSEYIDLSAKYNIREDGNIKLLELDEQGLGYDIMPKFFSIIDEDKMTRQQIKAFLIASRIYTNRKGYDEQIMYLDTLNNEKNFNNTLKENEIKEIIAEYRHLGFGGGRKQKRKDRVKTYPYVEFDYNKFEKLYDDNITTRKNSLTVETF